jgi:hypothetical protein
VPLLRLGAFDIPQVPAVFGTPIAEVEKGVEVDIDGIVGSGLLAYFRVTLTEEGRAMWLEDVPQSSPTAAPAPSSSSPPPATPKGDKGDKADKDKGDKSDKPTKSDKSDKVPKPKNQSKPKEDGPTSTP